MKAFIVYQPHHFEVAEAAFPTMNEDEVVVKVAAAAICHSDLDIIDGIRKHLVKYPVILGHEFAGVIVDKGKCVKNLMIGDQVVCECIVWCGVCKNCRQGLTGCCLNYSELGTMENGGFAEYVTVPAKMAHQFTRLSMDEASNVEPAGNGCHAVEKADIRIGDQVAVIGPGPIGLYALQFAKLKFPENLIMVGTRDERLAVAKTLGATHVFNINKVDAVAEIRELTHGRGVDRIIQCATTDAAFRLALAIAGMDSKIVIEGLSGSGQGINLKFDDFVIKPMSICGASGVFVNHYEKTLKLMEMGLIDAKPIITHKIGLERIEEGLAFLRSRQAGVLKIVVNP